MLDERFDAELLGKVAEMRPDWSFVMVGPVVKIAPEDLPHRPNIHYLGGKTYAELPAYLSGWDVALMPFAINESTQFISPTKTPEYLAGGKPVVSTPIRDVVRHYGDLEACSSRPTPTSFIDACDKALELSRNPEAAGWPRPTSSFRRPAGTPPRRAWAGWSRDLLGTRSAVTTPALLVAAE